MSPIVPTGIRQILCIKEIEGMINEVSRITGQLNDTEALYPLIGCQSRIERLFARIASIRQLNYRSQTKLEADQIKAVELWASISPFLKGEVKRKVAIIRLEDSALRLEIEACRNTPGVYLGDINSLTFLKKKISDYKSRVTDLSNHIQQYLAPLENGLSSLEQRVFTAEFVINLTSKASFKLKEDETPIIAVKAKDMNAKIGVLLTLTNKRMICESVSTGKTERQLLFEKPVRSVDKIAKGKLGLFAGEGLHVEFKQPSDPKLKLDMEGEDADLVVHYFNMITSGQIDEEIKSGINVTLCEHFEELARSWAEAEEIARKEEPKEKESEKEAHEDRKIGKCRECGTVVSEPIKKWTMEGGLEIGLFDCPTCKKFFREILNKAIDAKSEIDLDKGPDKKQYCQQVMPTVDTTRTAQGEVCASCGKGLGKHSYEKNLEQIYEAYPEYKGKKLCKQCGSQYQQSALYHKRLKDSKRENIKA